MIAQRKKTTIEIQSTKMHIKHSFSSKFIIPCMQVCNAYTIEFSLSYHTICVYYLLWGTLIQTSIHIHLYDFYTMQTFNGQKYWLTTPESKTLPCLFTRSALLNPIHHHRSFHNLALRHPSSVDFTTGLLLSSQILTANSKVNSTMCLLFTTILIPD